MTHPVLHGIQARIDSGDLAGAATLALEEVRRLLQTGGGGEGGDSGDAIEIAEAALAPPTLDGEPARSLAAALARAYEAAARPRDIVRLLGRALAAGWLDGPTIAVFDETFDRLRAHGNPAAALDGFLMLRGLAGDEAPVALKVAECLLALGQVEKARTYADGVLARSPANMLGRLIQRRAEGTLSALRLAELEMVLAGAAPASIERVRFTYEGQTIEAAPTSLLMAQAQRPEAYPRELLVIEQSERLLSLGRNDEALAALQKLTATYPLERRVRALKARAWRGKAMPDLALEEFAGLDPATLVGPGASELLLELARAQQATGHRSLALATFRKAQDYGSVEAARQVAILEALLRTQVEGEAAGLVRRAAGSTPGQGGGAVGGANRGGGESGLLVDGKYRIVERRGEGGMGVVYRVHNERLDREEALKLLPPHLSAQKEVNDSLLAEARALAALDHPNIVRVYALGRHEGRWYLTMEYLDGMTLRARMASSGRLALGEALSIARGLAAGLSYVHDHGIVHRDVKPENVMIAPYSLDVKLMDFGLARDLSSSAVQRRESFMGTIHYLAPELINGAPAGPRSDLYAFGIVLFEMLTGRVPFDSENPHNLMFLHLTRPPPAPRSLAPDVPPPLEALILRCLEKVPDRRFGGMGEIERLLTKIEKAQA